MLLQCSIGSWGQELGIIYKNAQDALWAGPNSGIYAQVANDLKQAANNLNNLKNARSRVLEIEKLFTQSGSTAEKEEDAIIAKMTAAEYKKEAVAKINQEYKKALQEIGLSIGGTEREELEAWKAEALNTIPAYYKQYSDEYDNELKEYQQSEEESIKEVGILLRDFYLQYPNDPDIKRVTESTAPIFYALENIRKDLFEAKDYRNILISNYKEDIKNNACEVKYNHEIPGSTTMGGGPLGMSYNGGRPTIVQKTKFDQKTCEDTLNKIFSLSILSGEENIEEITNLMNKYVKTQYAPAILSNLAAVLLSTGKHKMLFKFIEQQEKAENSGTYDAINWIDKITSARFLKYYLGPVSQYGAYPQGNVWEDIGRFIAQDKNKASQKFTSQRLAGMTFSSANINDPKLRVNINTMTPLFTGLLLGGGTINQVTVSDPADLAMLGGSATYVAKPAAEWKFATSVFNKYAAQEGSLTNRVTENNKGKTEEELLRGYKSASHYEDWGNSGLAVGGPDGMSRASRLPSNTARNVVYDSRPANPMSTMLQKYGNNGALSRALILFESSMLDLKPDAKLALDARLYRFYMKNGGDTNWLEMYSTETARYYQMKLHHMDKGIFQFYKGTFDAVLTIWGLWTLPGLFRSVAKGMNLIGKIGKTLYTAKSLKALKALPELAKTYEKMHQFVLRGKKIGKNTKYFFKKPKVYFRAWKMKNALKPQVGDELKLVGYTADGSAEVSGGAAGETVANYKAKLKHEDLGEFNYFVKKNNYKIDSKGINFSDGIKVENPEYVHLRFGRSKRGERTFSIIDSRSGQEMDFLLKGRAKELFKETKGKLFFNGEKLFADKNLTKVFEADINIPKWQMGRFVSLFNEVDRISAAGKITELVNLTKNTLTKSKFWPYYIINGFSLATATGAMYPILTSAPFIDKENPKNNLVSDSDAAILSMGLPYGLYILAPKVVRPLVGKFGAAKIWNASLWFGLAGMSAGAAGYAYEYFLKPKGADPKRSLFLGFLWMSAALSGASSVSSKVAVEVLSDSANLGTAFKTSRLFAKNVNSLLMWAPPALVVGGAAFWGKDKEFSKHGLGITYGSLTLLTGGLLWATKSRFKFKSTIGILEKGKAVKASLGPEVWKQMGALFLYTGFEGTALFKVSNSYINDKVGYSKRDDDWVKPWLGLLGGVVLAAAPAATRLGVKASNERLNLMLLSSTLSSAAGTGLLYFSDDPWLQGLGIGLVGYGTANIFTGMKQKMKNTVSGRNLGDDMTKILNSRIDNNIPIVNSALGIFPIASGVIVDDYRARNNAGKTEANIKTLWFPAGLLASGAMINYKGFNILPKMLPLGGLGYAGYKLYDGSLFGGFKYMPQSAADYKAPDLKTELNKFNGALPQLPLFNIPIKFKPAPRLQPQQTF
jgi:hypothetical protein